MLAKLLVATVGVGLLGAALLGLEHQRTLTAHAMADLHVQMDRDRKDTWDAQAKIAENSHPVALRAALGRTGLELVPLPTPDDLPAAAVSWPEPDRFEHAPVQTRVEPPADRRSPVPADE
jgi:hypothetical protein